MPANQRDVRRHLHARRSAPCAAPRRDCFDTDIAKRNCGSRRSNTGHLPPHFHVEGEGDRRPPRFQDHATAERQGSCPGAKRHMGSSTPNLVRTSLRRRASHLSTAVCRTSTWRSKGFPDGSYNWEFFFHAPLQVAIRLAKDGRHEEAQRWFHFIFDPTTDSSAPSPAVLAVCAVPREQRIRQCPRADGPVVVRRDGSGDPPTAKSRSAISCPPGGKNRFHRT